MTAQELLFSGSTWLIAIAGAYALTIQAMAFRAIEMAVRELARKKGWKNTQARSIIYPSNSYSIENPFSWNPATHFTTPKKLLIYMLVGFGVAFLCFGYITVLAILTYAL